MIERVDPPRPRNDLRGQYSLGLESNSTETWKQIKSADSDPACTGTGERDVVCGSFLQARKTKQSQQGSFFLRLDVGKAEDK